ncbi:MAG: WD40 repeat domain-containing protein [Actinobacteria bacterium]|nr:WD40 repeat domain-containing protein [Actinomycetota bacterium]
MYAIRCLAVLLLLVPATAACGGGEERNGSSLSLEGETFSIQPAGQGGRLVGYDASSGERRFSLPPGLTTADGTRHFASTVGRSGTTLGQFDASSGEIVRTVKLRGRWSLAGLSPNGRWLALERATQTPGRTHIAITRADSGRPEHVLELGGDFDVDAVSADGRSLFLIEHLADGRYLIRLYDLANERLLRGSLREKGSEQIMTGYAWSGLASPDGKWLLTLFIDTRRRNAFVHALNLKTGTPACIDLPSGAGGFEMLKRYSLSLHPGGDHLFAVNPALGVVADVDLRRLRVSNEVEFARTAGAVSTVSAISNDGRTLYFASGSRLWGFDSPQGRVRGPYSVDGSVAGVDFSRDGRRLYAVTVGGRVILFDAAGGEKIAA